jgi:Family of unknown function (DUF5996)
MTGTMRETFPPLPLEEWEDTKNTLHRFVQIVGKIRLASAPHANHWWHVTLYVTTRGLTTSPMPYGDITFAIDFDFIDHRLVISTSSGAMESFALEGLSVAQFYEQVFSTLSQLGIEVAIVPTPYDLIPAEPFTTNTIHAAYDKEYVNRYWRILVQVDMVFKEFSGRFTGKTSPVQLFWHSFDLAVTRFSGRRAPEREGADRATREAYSHEVISFGFWPGAVNIRAPAFYPYTAPEPAGLADQPPNRKKSSGPTLTVVRRQCSCTTICARRSTPNSSCSTSGRAPATRGREQPDGTKKRSQPSMLGVNNSMTRQFGGPRFAFAFPLTRFTSRTPTVTRADTLMRA